jgi:hypothetical protein
MVAAVAAGPGARADVALDAAYDTMHGAVVVQSVVHGPGPAAAAFFDVTIEADDLLLWTMRGGRFEAVYPPEAYAPRARSVHPRLGFPWRDDLATIEFGSIDGRGSDGDMPVFLLSDLEGRHGLWVALGWGGTWRAKVTKVGRTGTHRVTAEGPGRNVDLAEGEELALPRVFVGAYEGDGWAAVKRFLSDARRRRHEPWVVYNSWFNEEARINEERVLRHVPVAAELGFDAFCIDAAWYETSGDPADFHTRGLGTWTLDEKRFPGGLDKVSQAVRDAGMVFGLWFEPERCHPESQVWAEHPEWVRRAPDQEFGLVDFGAAAAREWALDVMSSAVERWTLGWLKWDMNVHKLTPFWAGDERAELAHNRGVWEVMSALTERHPDLVLEGCSSGGNRVDVEALLRCDTYWISDQTVSPDMVRGTMLNALRVLPAQHCYLSLSPQLEGQGVDDYPDEWFVGNMAGVFGIMELLAEWPPAVRERAARHIATFKSVRHLLAGDFRRFADCAEVPHQRWEAWELSDPATGEAALFALRLRSPDDMRVFHGAKRWEVTLPPEGAAVLHQA